ncbi:GNA1162 family protein [Marinobacter sp. C2H3]|uniref:GNA1162 family protein n=1 Tax=Marinobacter sp. C2H3 TaxID=3119003 RepID=UPI00300EBF61
MINTFKFIVLAVIISLTTACATQSNLLSKQEAYPVMYDEDINSIVVVPAINHSTAADAPILYQTSVAEPLAYMGHYVMPIEVTTELLHEQGVSDGEQLVDVPPQKFGDLFGADAVLFVTIDKWDTNYYVVGGNVTVGLHYVLRSTATGAQLWNYHSEQVVDTSDNSGNGLLVALIATAIKTANQDYLPIAKRVNNIAISTLPYGKYHPQSGKDGALKVVPVNSIAADH